VPNRIIREGWLESVNINQLDAPAERFFLRLCLRVDDYGRFHANPTLLRSSLFPLRDDVRSADIPRWIAACEKAGLVRCYKVTGTDYIEVARFNQRMRSAVSKFPDPPTNDGQMTDIGQTDDGHPRTETEAEAETEQKAKESSPPKPPALEKEKFVGWFLELLAATEAPKVRLSPSVRASWADCYDKMIRLDKRSKEEIKAVCHWAREDPFWRKNFLSPMKLRQQNDGGVMWFDAFTAKMNDRGPAEKVRVNIVEIDEP